MTPVPLWQYSKQGKIGEQVMQKGRAAVSIVATCIHLNWKHQTKHFISPFDFAQKVRGETYTHTVYTVYKNEWNRIHASTHTYSR